MCVQITICTKCLVTLCTGVSFRCWKWGLQWINWYKIIRSGSSPCGVFRKFLLDAGLLSTWRESSLPSLFWLSFESRTWVDERQVEKECKFFELSKMKINRIEPIVLKALSKDSNNWITRTRRRCKFTWSFEKPTLLKQTINYKDYTTTSLPFSPVLSFQTPLLLRLALLDFPVPIFQVT